MWHKLYIYIFFLVVFGANYIGTPNYRYFNNLKFIVETNWENVNVRVDKKLCILKCNNLNTYLQYCNYVIIMLHEQLLHINY